MDFDPLSLFTPSKLVELPSHEEEYERPLSHSVDYDIEDLTHLEPLHFLDLPMMRLQPTADVLLVFLKLLAPGEILNFAPDENDESDIINEEEVFKAKNICPRELQQSLTWFESKCSRFNTTKKLAFLPSLSTLLKENYTTEYNRFLTSIIADDLSWIEEDKTDPIKKEASLRLSENCGRSAQPDRIRKITIEGLSRFLPTGDKISLMEPSLTSDNLGLKTWGSSLILASRLVKKKEYLRGEPLELGSGTGLVGIVSNLVGYPTILTDLKEITPNLQHNLDLNSIESTAQELDWRDHSTFRVHHKRKFSTILISDPIYSSQHPYWLISTIDEFFDTSDKDSRILLEIPLRPKFEKDRQVLWGLFEEHGYIEIEHEIEDGFDDFGAMQFCFKMYQKA